MSSHRFFVLLPVAVVACFFWRVRAGEWDAMRWTGAILLVPALILFCIAHWQLGSSFAVRAQAKNLVTTGIYSRIRNPIYLFGGLLIAGLFLFMEEPNYLLILLVILPMQWFRVRQEEKVLEEKFGEAYRQYKKNTWF
ncbi:MAG: isoprenylcysteine carboxylmethyltransferase family protein [Candidatus Acidiferrales bacterium]